MKPVSRDHLHAEEQSEDDRHICENERHALVARPRHRQQHAVSQHEHSSQPLEDLQESSVTRTMFQESTARATRTNLVLRDVVHERSDARFFGARRNVQRLCEANATEQIQPALLVDCEECGSYTKTTN